ncbi:MAG TPA: SMC-Scp complex subunit ScpB [Hyphomonadaceae bacterium]|nr:SMC-Scp complex subunit ScpB [Hyphomonadaceae bacterium]
MESHAISFQADLPFDPQVELAKVDALRIVEALLLVSPEPVPANELQARLPKGVDLDDVADLLRRLYAGRGIEFVAAADGFRLQTARDLGYLFEAQRVEPRKLSKPAMEILAIIAYHQPVTRAEIEAFRGVSVGKGALDILLEIGWVRPRGRRRTPGRPMTYGTTPAFLAHFGLPAIDQLPGRDDLRAAGLLDARLDGQTPFPIPSDKPTADEDPLDQEDANFHLDFIGAKDDGNLDQAA